MVFAEFFVQHNVFKQGEEPVEESYFDKDRNLKYRLTFTYGLYGEQSGLISYKADGKIDYKLTYLYEDNDVNGNWLKETTYENGKPIIVVERRITYY